METVQNKSGMHIQSQIRHNAEELKNTLNDLYSWEKEMKDKEQKLKLVKESNDATSHPIRSQPSAMEELGVKKSVNQPKNKTIEAEEEKQRRLQLAETFKERGNKNVKLGDYQTAVENYTAAIEAFENDPKFYTNRALCYLKLEKYDECIEDCNRAIEIDNLSVKAYYRRMQANEYLGFNTKALKDCTTVLMIDSKNSDAKASLKRINQRLKKTGAVPKGYSTGDSNSLIEGPHFSPLRSNTIDILPTNKPSYARSKKPLKKIPIIDVIGPKDGKNFENSNIQISDEVIDKLFNGECGSYEEVKKTATLENVNIQTEVQDSNKISADEIAPKPTKLTKLEAELSSTTKDRPLPPPPTSTAQFYCNWKELSAQQKYQYLKSIEVSQVNKILGAGFDSDILSELLKTLNEFYVSNKENVCETLLEISKHDRLPILSLLLSSEDTTALSQLIDYIQKCNSGASTESVNLIKKSFNLD